MQMLPVVEGETVNGHWSRGGFVLQAMDGYDRVVAFTVFGDDRVQAIQGLRYGDVLTVNYTLSSREFNDRWYTEARASAVSIAQRVAMRREGEVC